MEKEDLVIHLLRESRIDIKEIKDDISTMKVDVALNTDDLKTHMRRTELNERRLALIEERHEKRMASLEDKLTLGHLLKLIVTVASGIGVISGSIYGIIRLFNM